MVSVLEEVYNVAPENRNRSVIDLSSSVDTKTKGATIPEKETLNARPNDGRWCQACNSAISRVDLIEWMFKQRRR